MSPTFWLLHKISWSVVFIVLKRPSKTRQKKENLLSLWKDLADIWHTKTWLSNSGLFPPIWVNYVFLTDKLFLLVCLISGVLQEELWVLDVPLLLQNNQKVEVWQRYECNRPRKAPLQLWQVKHLPKDPQFLSRTWAIKSDHFASQTPCN